MSWRNDLATWRDRSRPERALVAEALVFLTLFRAAVHTLPFRYVAALGRLAPGEDHTPLSPESAARAGRVGWAIRAVAARRPWQAVCLPQAVAGMAMLRRRR